MKQFSIYLFSLTFIFSHSLFNASPPLDSLILQPGEAQFSQPVFTVSPSEAISCQLRSRFSFSINDQWQNHQWPS